MALNQGSIPSCIHSLGAHRHWNASRFTIGFCTLDPKDAVTSDFALHPQGAVKHWKFEEQSALQACPHRLQGSANELADVCVPAGGAQLNLLLELGHLALGA